MKPKYKSTGKTLKKQIKDFISESHLVVLRGYSQHRVLEDHSWQCLGDHEVMEVEPLSPTL